MRLSGVTVDRRQFCEGAAVVGCGVVAAFTAACIAPQEEDEGYEVLAQFQAAPLEEGHTLHGVVERRYGRLHAVPRRVYDDEGRTRPTLVGGRAISGLTVYAIGSLGGDPREPHGHEIHYLGKDGQTIWIPMAWHLQPAVAGERYALIRWRKKMVLPAPEELYPTDRERIAVEDAWAFGG